MFAQIIVTGALAPISLAVIFAINSWEFVLFGIWIVHLYNTVKEVRRHRREKIWVALGGKLDD